MFRSFSARRVVSIGVGVVGAVIFTATTASAEVPAPDVPQDVATLLSGSAVEQVQAAAAETQQQATSTQGDAKALNSIGVQAPDLSGGLAAGPAHQVYGFTDAFTQGAVTDAAVAPTAEWLAPLLRNGEPAGTIRVWKPSGGPAELAGYTGDVVLATSLLVDSSVVIVEDGTIDAYYRLDGDTLTPLPASGQTEFTGPVSLAKAQSVISARRTTSAEAAAEASKASNGTDRMIVGSSIAFVGAAGVVMLLSRRRKARSLTVD